MSYLFKLQIIKYIGHLYNYILICTDSTYKRKFISYLSENMEVYIYVLMRAIIINYIILITDARVHK